MSERTVLGSNGAAVSKAWETVAGACAHRSAEYARVGRWHNALDEGPSLVKVKVKGADKKAPKGGAWVGGEKRWVCR